MTTLKLYSPEVCVKHLGFPFFSEKPERLERVNEMLKGLGIGISPSRPARHDMVIRAHSESYLRHIQQIAQKGLLSATFANITSPYVQPYTRVSKHSYRAALYAAGAVCEAVDAVLHAESTNAFCAVRPPGHHAGRSRGEGFCLLNNVAIGALYAVSQGYRVAIVDFDRHHGNGTEEIISYANTENLLFISSYQDGCKYSLDDVRMDNSASYMKRVPLPEYSNFSVIGAYYHAQVAGVLQAFRPDLLLLSAGFDMHHADPLTNLRLQAEDFESLTNILVSAVADSGSRIVSVLEGGYDLDALPECVRYHLKALM